MKIDLGDPGMLARAGDPAVPVPELRAILEAWKASPRAEMRIATALAGNPALPEEDLRDLAWSCQAESVANPSNALALLGDPRMGERLVLAISAAPPGDGRPRDHRPFSQFLDWLRRGTDVPAWLRRALVGAPVDARYGASIRRAEMFLASCRNPHADPEDLAASTPLLAWHVWCLIVQAAVGRGPIVGAPLVEREAHPWWGLRGADPQPFLDGLFDPSSPWSSTFVLDVGFWAAFLPRRWGRMLRLPEAWDAPRRMATLLAIASSPFVQKEHLLPEDAALVAPGLSRRATLGDDGSRDACRRLGIGFSVFPDLADRHILIQEAADDGLDLQAERLGRLLRAWGNFPDARKALKALSRRRFASMDIDEFEAAEALLRAWEDVDPRAVRGLWKAARSSNPVFRLWHRLRDMYPSGGRSRATLRDHIPFGAAVLIHLCSGRDAWEWGIAKADAGKVATAFARAGACLTPTQFDAVVGRYALTS